MYNVLYWCHTQAIFPPPNGLGIYKAMGYMPDQFTILVYYLTYLLGRKDVDVLSVAGGSKLRDIFIVDRREINSKIEVDCSHHCRVCGVDNVVLGGREGTSY